MTLLLLSRLISARLKTRLLFQALVNSSITVTEPAWVVGGILWASVIAGGVRTWIGYDAFTGKWVFNETNVPLYSGPPGAPEATVLSYTPQGQIVRYVLNYNAATHTGSIALWNNTQDNIGIELQPPYSNESVAATTNAYQWRPNGKTVDMSRAYSWNVSISADLTGSAAPYIVQLSLVTLYLAQAPRFTRSLGTAWALRIHIQYGR